MPHSYSSSLFHIVFSTKERRNLITSELQPRLWSYLGGIARENDMKALAVGGVANHIHILLSMPATIALAKSIQLIKGGSSKWVHETFPTLTIFEWQEGYAAFSIAVSGVSDTIKYIENQAEHHQTTSFEDEYLAFLERHRIAFDPRYVFD
jgi:putative transposase